MALHASPADRFLTRVGWLIDDLTTAPTGDGKVIVGDSRNPDVWTRALEGQQALACVSSPPYLNNFDYADATRLELYFLGMATTWAEMCRVARDHMIIASTQQTTRGRAAQAWNRLASYPITDAALQRLENHLRRSRRERPRGKEYDQLLPAYFADMSEVLANALCNLKADGRLLWVVGDSAPYGVYVDTPKLISQLGEEIGFEPLLDVALRPRGTRWTQNGQRHHVELSERLLLLRKPGRS
jgi:hypothetical protein